VAEGGGVVRCRMFYLSPAITIRTRHHIIKEVHILVTVRS